LAKAFTNARKSAALPTLSGKVSRLTVRVPVGI
jgi:hypothetical protein